MANITLIGKNGTYWFNPFPPNKPLGSGGMGVVYSGLGKIRTTEGIKDCPVAVKILYSELTDNQFIDRFIREAEIQLKLDHPHIIKSYDFVVERGKYHIVSKLIKGMLITDYLAIPQNVTLENKIRLFEQILDGLHVLHSHRPVIIHRDIKPQNIMIENGNAVIMDLGVAKVTDGKRQTAVGIIIGTPQYSAPEQIRGLRESVNASTDIYSTGITFYELLTGKTPFDGTNQYSIMEMQVKMPIPYCEGIPKRLFDVLRKATEKEQYKRFQTALEFKDAIHEAYYGKPNLWEVIKAFFRQIISSL